MNKKGLSEIKKSRSLLPYTNKNIDYWIENDSRPVKEKAVLMFFQGNSYEYISNKLNLRIEDIRHWILAIYGKDEHNCLCQRQRRNKPLSIPDNFSVWNSKNIYNFWNKLKTRQKVK